MKLLTILALTLFVNSTFAMTKEQEITYEIQSELNLPSDTFETIHEAVLQEQEVREEKKPKKQRNRTFFCAHSYAAFVLDGMVLKCRNIKGAKYQISFLGLGGSFSLNTGLSILFPIEKSSMIEPGSYSGGQLSLHLGLGMTNLVLRNESKNIHYQLMGLTIGVGFNYSDARITIDEIQKKKKDS